MSAPPGFNPNQSMLSGGDSTPIMKVMGGGGLPPSDYNITDTMLKGGDAPIVKVLGGGGGKKQKGGQSTTGDATVSIVNRIPAPSPAATVSRKRGFKVGDKVLVPDSYGGIIKSVIDRIEPYTKQPGNYTDYGDKVWVQMPTNPPTINMIKTGNYGPLGPKWVFEDTVTPVPVGSKTPAPAASTAGSASSSARSGALVAVVASPPKPGVAAGTKSKIYKYEIGDKVKTIGPNSIEFTIESIESETKEGWGDILKGKTDKGESVTRNESVCVRSKDLVTTYDTSPSSTTNLTRVFNVGEEVFFSIPSGLKATKIYFTIQYIEVKINGMNTQVFLAGTSKDGSTYKKESYECVKSNLKPVSAPAPGAPAPAAKTPAPAPAAKAPAPGAPAPAAKTPAPSPGAPAPAPAAPAPAAPPIMSGFQVEVYDPVIPVEDDNAVKAFMEDIRYNLTVTKIWRNHFFYLMKEFKEFYFRKWQRIQKDGKTVQGDVLKLNQCALGAKPIRNKLVQVVQKEAKTIIVIPPVNGDLLFLLRTLNFLYNNNCFDTIEDDFLQLKSNYTLVFLSPFFILDEKSLDVQNELLYIFFKLWNANRENLFVLQEDDDKSIQIGCSFYQFMPSEQAQGKDYLINMLNPSYLVIKTPVAAYPGILFSTGKTAMTSGVPKSKNANFLSLSEVLDKHASVSLNPDANNFDEPFSKYLTLLSEGTPDSLPAPRLETEICNSLRTIFYDEDLKKNIYKINDNSVYIFRLGEKRTLPLFCMEESGKAKFLLPRPGMFRGSEKNPNFFGKVPLKSIFYEGETFYIRLPILDTQRKNPVRENWLEGIFSDEEAKFLTVLGLNPLMLGKVFEEKWKQSLADFLESVAISDCFEDVTLLTKGECQSAYRFLEKIREWLFLNAIVEMDDDPLLRMSMSTDKSRVVAATLPRPPPISFSPDDEMEDEAVKVIPWPKEGDFVEISKEEFKPSSKGGLDHKFNADKAIWFQDVRLVYKKTGALAYYRIFLPKISADKLTAKGTKLGSFFAQRYQSLNTKYGEKFNFIL